MANKRKYPTVSGYWVYSIQIKSNGKYYIGVSKLQCYQRWNKSAYKGKSLESYLDEWDSMEKTVLIDGLSKEEAYQYEDNIIQTLSMNNLCINKNHSGLIEVSDKNEYNKQHYENNKEKKREQNKQYYEDNKEKISKQRRQRRLKKKLEQTSLQQ